MHTVQRKLDHISDFLNQAKKQDDKLKVKRAKLLSEGKFKDWDNPDLLSNFSEEDIRKLTQRDREAAMLMILPKEQQEIDDLKMLSAYLTESLISEMDRVKTQVALRDFLAETRQFNFAVRDNFREAVQICDTTDGLIKV